MRKEYLEEIKKIFSNHDVNEENICEEVINEIIHMKERGLEVMTEIIKRLERIEELSDTKIQMRTKSVISTLYQALRNNNIDDFYGVRIIADSDKECYLIKTLLCRNFEYVDSRTKDFILYPKGDAGYQSLHVTLKTSDGTPFEVQIRTMEMHITAENGDAAHSEYKRYQWGEESFELIKTLPMFLRCPSFYEFMNDKILITLK